MRIAEFHIHLHADQQSGPFEESFEEMVGRLERLPKLYFEPDGSVLWCPVAGQEISAMIYDAHGHVQYVDVWGKIGQPSWNRFIEAISPSLSISILNLSGSQWQDLQDFEHFTWQAAR